jgi:hypothetical protein
MTTFEKINDALLCDIMAEADLADIAPMTAKFMQTLGANDAPAVLRFANELKAARQTEIEDQADDVDMVVERQDAMLAGLKPYLHRNRGAVS